MRWVALVFAVIACSPSIEGAPCETDENCPTGQVCDAASCEFFVPSASGGGSGGGGAMTGGGSGTCDTGNQPGGCGYGGVCSSTNQCDQLTEGTCAHIANASSRTRWTSTATGPVIFNVVDEADIATDCTTGNAFTMTIYAYAGTTPFPSQVSGLPRLFNYAATGAGVDITPLLTQAGYSVFNGGAQMGVKFSQCSPQTTPLELGLAFVGGNGVCTTQTR